MNLSTRARVAIVLAVLALVTAGLVAFAMAADPNTGRVYTVGVQPTEPTLPPQPSVTAPPAEPVPTTIVAPGSTVSPQDPNTFATRAMPGPIQVRIVGKPSCERDRAGQPIGYLVRLEVSNDGPRKAGELSAQLDLQTPVVPLSPGTREPIRELTLARGASHAAAVLVPGSGELVTVTWQGRTTFPVEVEFCQPDRDDEEAAGDVTVTT